MAQYGAPVPEGDVEASSINAIKDGSTPALPREILTK